VLGRFLSPSIGLIGIDVAHDGIRMLQLRGSGGRVDVVAAAQLDGGSTPPPDLRRRIRAAMLSGRFTGRRCVVSIPRELVHVRTTRMPPMPGAPVEAVASHFDLDGDRLETSCFRTGAQLEVGEWREEVVLVGASRRAIEGWRRPITDAGLRGVAVEPWFAGLSRLLGARRDGDEDGPRARAIVDVSRSGATVLILRDERIAVCRTVPIGGEHFDRALAGHLRMGVPAARDLRDAHIEGAGSGVHRATDRAIFEAVRPLMGELAREINLCLRSYGAAFRGPLPERLILCGDDSTEPRLDEVLHRSCPVTIASDDEEGTLAGLAEAVGSRLHGAPGPATGWVVAGGLGLRGTRRDEHRERRAA
jgi:Tfp pilus assembly PilM family ATPase